MHVGTCAPLVCTLLSLGFELHLERQRWRRWSTEEFLTCQRFVLNVLSRACVPPLPQEEKGVRETRGNLMDPGSKCERKQHVYIMETGYVLALTACLLADTWALTLSCHAPALVRTGLLVCSLARCHHVTVEMAWKSHGCLATLVMSCSRARMLVFIFLFHYWKALGTHSQSHDQQ